MSNFETRASWTENPFVFLQSMEIDMGTNIDMEVVPLHRALYDKMVKLVIPSPKSKTDPYSDKGRREWRPGFDPESRLDPTSVAPGLIEGTPLQSRRRKEPQGEGGFATFVNIIVDRSGSMSGPLSGGGASYGYFDGLPLGGEDLARVVTALMIKMASINGDLFNVISYGSNAKVDWAGPTNDYTDAIDYYCGSATGADGGRPLAADMGGTNTAQAMNLCKSKMEQYLEEKNVAVQAAVTIVISDGAYSYDSCMEADTWLRQYGPVFYVFMAPQEGMMDTNVAQMQATLKKVHKGLSCPGCVMSFVPKVGQTGSVSDFAGTLVEMANTDTGGDCDYYE